MSWGPSDVRKRLTIRQAAEEAQRLLEKEKRIAALGLFAEESGEPSGEQASDPDGGQASNLDGFSSDGTSTGEDEEDNLEDWQRLLYPYRVRATLKAQWGATGKIPQWTNKIGTSD